MQASVLAISMSHVSGRGYVPLVARSPAGAQRGAGRAGAGGADNMI